MKFIIINLIILTFIVIVLSEASEGSKNSFFFPSNNGTIFDYSQLNDIIIFGDSYSTTNTIIENMTYTGKNQSGGKNWPLYLVDYHDMYIWNFAFNGAPIINEYVIQSNKYALPKQLEYFKSKMVDEKEFSNWEGETTLVAFWFGINDILKSTLTHQETVDKGLKYMFEVVKEIYNYGARNFLFFYVPPIDLSPLIVNGAYWNIPQFIDTFNTNIKKKVEMFSNSHPLANCILYNSFDEFNYLLEKHLNFNITDITNEYKSHPKSNRENFFWNDDIHPTDKVHKLLTDDLNLYMNNISANKIETKNIISEKSTSRFISSSSIKKVNITNISYYGTLIIFVIYFILSL